jgi:SAM-dependent methyltransferase
MRSLDINAIGAETVSCARCDSTDTRIRYRKFNFPIVQCRMCGLVYANPRPSKEDIWRRYNPRYFEQEYLPAQGVVDGHVDASAFDARYAELLARIASRVPKRGRLFEIGAGCGLFLSAAARAGWQVSGIELSPAAAGFARDRLHLDVSACAAEAMPVDVPPFDVVVMFDVIEHLFDPMAVIRAIRFLLRRNGLLVVLTPNYDALSRRALGRQWATLNPFEHLFYFTEWTLWDSLAAGGFGDIEFVRHYGSWSMWDTMNPRNTHAPGSRRAAAYQRLVARLGPRCYQWVQGAGKGDILLAMARAI